MGSAASVLDLTQLTTQEVLEYINQDEQYIQFAEIVKRHGIDGRVLSTLHTADDLKYYLKSIYVNDEDIVALSTALIKLIRLGKSDINVDHSDQPPLMGLTISALLQFITDCGGRDSLRSLSSEDVVAKYIKPITMLANISYCDFKSSAEGCASGFGTASVFVSHSRGEGFLEFVDILHEHFGQNDSIFLWVEMFCFPQNSINSVAHIAIKSVIARIDNTVVVMDSWMKKSPFMRTWCIWEIISSLLRPRLCKISVILSTVELSSLINEFSVNWEFVLNNLCVFDVINSYCYDYDTKQVLLKAVQSLMSLEICNRQLYSFAKDWLSQTVQKAMQSEVDNILQQAKLKLALAHIYQLDAIYDTAEKLFTEALAELRSRLGNLNEVTLSAIYDYALCLKNSGKLVVCIPLLKECMELRTILLGADHVDTLRCMNVLSVVYITQQDFTSAEVICRQCYETLRAKYGVGMHETLVAMNNYGHVLKSCKLYDRAELILRECWQVRMKISGDNDIETLNTLALLAATLIKLNRIKEAKPMLTACLSKFTSMFGADHPRTHKCKHLLDVIVSKKSPTKSVKSPKLFFEESRPSTKDSIVDTNIQS